jgi:hypothetical protein
MIYSMSIVIKFVTLNALSAAEHRQAATARLAKFIPTGLHLGTSHVQTLNIKLSALMLTITSFTVVVIGKIHPEFDYKYKND